MYRNQKETLNKSKKKNQHYKTKIFKNKKKRKPDEQHELPNKKVNVKCVMI
jgi:hypothetical protein